MVEEYTDGGEATRAGLQYWSGMITEERYRASMGRLPVDDELERANCPLFGQLNHTYCGWCELTDVPNAWRAGR